MDELFQICISFFASFSISLVSWSHNSLSFDGAIAAFFVGAIHFFVNFKFAFLLIVFFLTSSRFTKVGSKTKNVISNNSIKDSKRNSFQVLCNGGFGSIIWSSDHIFSTFFQCALIGHYSCTTGDTWASELGILSTNYPRLITNFKKVPKGTNGGVTFLGTLFSLIGGLIIGISFYLLSESNESKDIITQYFCIILSGLMGLIGSLIDSLLGATLQYTGFDISTQKIIETPFKENLHITGYNILSNNSVNLISAIISSLISGYLSLCIFYH